MNFNVVEKNKKVQKCPFFVYIYTKMEISSPVAVIFIILIELQKAVA